jgi:hypothetical protein
MATLAHYRTLKGDDRAAWRNFYNRYVSTNPTDAYLAMGTNVTGYGFRGFVNAAWSGSQMVTESDAWPGIPWIQNDAGSAPDPTTPGGDWSFYPMSSWLDTPTAWEWFPDGRKIKPQRSYDTGVCRRRRNKS